MAYRKSIKYHKYKADIRCLLYCLLLVEEYTLNINEDAYMTMLNKLRERYFNNVAMSDVIRTTVPPDGIVHIENDQIMFASDTIRHDVMYAFVTECLVEDSDLEFFLTTASRDVISEYCRSWEYERSEEERCLFVPRIPENMYDIFINKLQLDIITHVTVSDQNIQGRINKHLGVPREVLQWDQEARERYVKYTKRGTQAVHHARGMIVGCAGAGKTTLLKRLLNPEEKEIPNVTSTEGLEVHEEIFEICDGKLKIKSNTDKHISENKKPGDMNNSLEEDITKTLSFFDFGGQCAYYACHQIYLTRRAFYILVVDASKHLYQEVDKNTCDQEDTVFNGWTYKDYFEFWLKSIHTYCSQPTEKEENVDVMIVVTHWENRIDQDAKAFDKILRNTLSPHSNLGQYIGENSLFYAQFPLEPLKELEKFIVDLAMSRKWSEKIPYEWKFLNQEIEDKRMIKRIMPFSDVCKRMPVNENEKNESTKDMLRYYHDAGKVLYFNEEGLKETVIIDVQWFVDAFKNIITDANHVKGINTVKLIWDEYYTTGNLQSDLLSRIWEKADEKLLKSLIKENASIEKDDPRFLLHHKEVLLSYMQRLGLIAIGETSHYVPCMNKKPFADQQMDIIKKAPLRSTVLVFLFDFLPFFLFYRLVVKLMVNRTFKVLRNKDISCLYKNAALFSYKDHNIAVAVTSTTIQLQIYQPESGLKLKKKVTLFIRQNIEQVMEDITTTFHKHLSYRIGYTCDEEEDQILGKGMTHNFIDETELKARKKMTCPNHQMENRHTINPKYLRDYWN
ncbi:probable serine/threonine-protein kinase pats1 [Saccostrea echinata]|uniref:probable serine/threonine-protein kinase pats1 n=1 Tax=Saccostrea echinata TaxID=191078 RepID=UPI002A82E085|nr:probable serine/threonine-protein kinase pats1 [Saccostrea echinata]